MVISAVSPNKWISPLLPPKQEILKMESEILISLEKLTFILSLPVHPLAVTSTQNRPLLAALKVGFVEASCQLYVAAAVVASNVADNP